MFYCRDANLRLYLFVRLMLREIQKKFVEMFSKNPRLFRSPGRINIIGEHTDYNNGFVLPAAIDKEIYFAIAPNTQHKYRLYSYDKQSLCEVVEVAPQKSPHWCNYLLGVIAQMQKRGVVVPTVDLVFGGNIPVGFGLSSSAALECGFAYALNTIFNLGFSKLELVQMSQLAEHEYVGVHCGIMDQFAVMFGKQDSVIQLDCKTLEYQYFPFQLDGYTVLLCNSNVKHNLASSEYNVRRCESEAGVKVVASQYSGIQSLRDISMEQLENCKSQLQGKSYNRCRYVIEENNRLQNACQAMLRGDVQTIGEMMFETHEGLSKQYEVSCPEIDIMVEIARSCGGVVGSRMMGGGFGGCTISIVKNEAIALFKQKMKTEYYDKYNKEEAIFEVDLCDGTSEIE